MNYTSHPVLTAAALLISTVNLRAEESTETITLKNDTNYPISVHIMAGGGADLTRGNITLAPHKTKTERIRTCVVYMIIQLRSGTFKSDVKKQCRSAGSGPFEFTIKETEHGPNEVNIFSIEEGIH
jgi:hypothetical protein